MLLSTLLFATAVVAVPASRLVVHEKRSAPGHLVRRRLDGDIILPVRIALTQSNLEEGYAYLMVNTFKSCQLHHSDADNTTHTLGYF